MSAGNAARPGMGMERSKNFFFEKKKQKTFGCSAAVFPDRPSLDS
jgi:hypothetical protein